MKNLMIDLETLDTRPSAVVLSIGAVFFDYEEGLGPEFYSGPIKIDPQFKRGRTASHDTLAWCVTQPDAVRLELFTHQVLASHPDAVINSFNLFSVPASTIMVWCNGANFDGVIWRSFCESFDRLTPWTWRHERCYRTEIEEHPIEVNVDRGLAHHALEDAKYQARVMLARHEAMKGSKK